MKERVSKLTYPTLLQCLRMLYTMKGIRDGQSDKKGDINCSSRGSTSISCKNAHLHIMSFITTNFIQFCWAVSVELCWPTVSVVSFIFVNFRSSKRAKLREKKWNQNFLWICTCTHYVLYNYKVSRNSVERFQRSCATKKNRTDGLPDWLTDRLTDGRVKNKHTSATRCVGYKNVILTS